jgi:hypothetical protein
VPATEDEVRALRAEVEALRAEVAALRAQPAPVLPAALPCTCGTTAVCAAHPGPRPWPGNVWISAQNQWNSACAGGYPGQVYTVLPGDSPIIWTYNNTGCAGGVGQQVICNTAAGQY